MSILIDRHNEVLRQVVCTVLLTLMCLVRLTGTGWSNPPTEIETVKYDTQSTTKGIQTAIDRIEQKGGGAVFIPAGIYEISRPIMLCSNLLIFGEGGATIIKSEKEYSSLLLEDARITRNDITKDKTYTIKVAEPEKFKIDDAITLAHFPQPDGRSLTIGVVVKVDNSAITLSSSGLQELEGPYNEHKLERKAIAVHTYGLLRIGTDKMVENLVVKDMKLIGSMKNNFQGVSSWFANAGIYFHANNMTLENLVLQDIPGDGITCGGKGIRIINNEINQTGYIGIHIGDGPSEVNISGNFIYNIKGSPLGTKNQMHHGIYLCSTVRRANITNNTISDIDSTGIGGLGEAKDAYVNISNNVIYKVSRWGIHFSRHNTQKDVQGKFFNIASNTIYEIGQSGITIFAASHINVNGNNISQAKMAMELDEAEYCNISNNIFADNRVGINLLSKATKNLIQGNMFSGNEKDIITDDMKRNKIENNFSEQYSVSQTSEELSILEKPPTISKPSTAENSPPSEKSPSTSVIVLDSFDGDLNWQFRGYEDTTGKIAIDNAVFKEGKSSLMVEYDLGNQSDCRIEWWNINGDWSKGDGIGLWLYGDKSWNNFIIRFYINDNDYAGSGYIPINWTGWKYIYIPKNKFGKVGIFDWGKINYSYFTIESSGSDAKSSGKIYLDNLVLTSE